MDKNVSKIIWAVVAIVSAFGAMFTAPHVAIYFWKSILVQFISVQAPTYWLMFALLMGCRWMLFGDLARQVVNISSIVSKQLQDEDEKLNALKHSTTIPWVTMGVILLVTYLCK